ncbi:hypothetical protein BKA70DRAFT_1435072 [Coprinopsis sp. MPI-PUGE-AT-0042]|nr:hypothetical protein BKA70DRAFT_1435072 [Coprinopsis sp. MPI-PUGE-AT-0042]
MSEPLASALCKIPANPDIAGIGVRISIYAQNIICILSALRALWDGNVTSGELEYAETQTLATTNLILAFAILISSMMVQASTLGISDYHAKIALIMSWMNNTDAFVYFILDIHHKTGLQGDEEVCNDTAYSGGTKDGSPRQSSAIRGKMDFAGVEIAFASSVEGLDGFRPSGEDREEELPARCAKSRA